VDEDPNGIMADTLLTGTTLVEKESRSIGDIPIGGFAEWDDTFGNLPDGYVLADGSIVNDPLSAWNGTAVQNLNTEYLSIDANGFGATNPDLDDVTHGQSGEALTLTSASVIPVAPVELPNGSIITAAVVYSSVSTENWSLASRDIEDAGNSIIHATAALNTEDTTITTPTINNENKRYFFFVANMDASDIMYGARITYTPRNKFIMRTR